MSRTPTLPNREKESNPHALFPQPSTEPFDNLALLLDFNFLSTRYQVPGDQREAFDASNAYCEIVRVMFKLNVTPQDSYQRLDEEKKNSLAKQRDECNKNLLACCAEQKYFAALPLAKLGYVISLKSCDPNIRDEALKLAMSAYILGGVFQEINENNKAIHFLKKTLELRKQHPIPSDDADLTKKITDKLNRAEEAIKTLSVSIGKAN